MATKAQLRQWFKDGIDLGATHMLVTRDDGPRYLRGVTHVFQAVGNAYFNYTDVYDLTAQMEPQIKAEHVWALDPSDPAVKSKPKGFTYQKDSVKAKLTIDTVTPYVNRPDETFVPPGVIPLVAARITEEQWQQVRADNGELKRQLEEIREEREIQAALIETLQVDRQRLFAAVAFQGDQIKNLANAMRGLR